MRFGGALPGMDRSLDSLARYDVWDKAPTEKYLERAPEESFLQSARGL